MWLFPFWLFASVFILLVSIQSNCSECIWSDEVIFKMLYFENQSLTFLSMILIYIPSKGIKFETSFALPLSSMCHSWKLHFSQSNPISGRASFMSRVICTNGEFTLWQMSLWYKFNKEHLNKHLLSKLPLSLDQKIRNLPPAYRFSFLLPPHLTFAISLMVRKADFLTFSLTQMTGEEWGKCWALSPFSKN